MALTTLATAIEAVADLTGDYLSGTCTSIGGAAGATLIDTRLQDKSRDTDDYFNNQNIYITAGTSVAGDERIIKDFAKAGTVTPYEAFTAQVPDESTYLIFSLWAAGDYRRALNRAIVDAYPWIAKQFVDETLDTVADTWSYNLGDYGTATGSSTVSLTDSSKSWQTNQFATLVCQSGGNSGTIASNTATALTVTSWSPSTPSTVAAYQIVHPIREVFDVSYQTDSTVTTRPYAPIPFDTREHNGVITVQLRAYPPPDRALRIVGRGPLTPFTSTTTSTTEIGEPYVKAIYYLAAHHLFQRSPSLSASQDREFYEKRATHYYGLWEHEIGRRKSRTSPKRVWGSGMGMVNGPELYYLAANDTPGTS